MLQFDWLLKCRDIEIMTLRGAKTNFLLTLDMQQSKRHNANNGLRIVVRNGEFTHIHPRMFSVSIS